MPIKIKIRDLQSSNPTNYSKANQNNDFTSSNLVNNKPIDFTALKNVSICDLPQSVKLQILKDHLDNLTFNSVDRKFISENIPHEAIIAFQICQRAVKELLKTQEIIVCDLNKSQKELSNTKKILLERKHRRSQMQEIRRTKEELLRQQHIRIAILQSTLQNARQKSSNDARLNEQRQLKDFMSINSNVSFSVITQSASSTSLSSPPITIQLLEHLDTKLIAILPLIQRHYAAASHSTEFHYVVVSRLHLSGQIIYDATDPFRIPLDAIQTLRQAGVKQGDVLVANILIHEPTTKSNKGQSEIFVEKLVLSQQETMKEVASEMRRGWESASNALVGLRAQETETASAARLQADFEEKEERARRELLAVTLADRLSLLEQGMRDQLNSQLQTYDYKLHEALKLHGSRTHVYAGELDSDGDGPLLSGSEVLAAVRSSKSHLDKLDSELAEVGRRVGSLQSSLDSRMNGLDEFRLQLERGIKAALVSAPKSLASRQPLSIRSDTFGPPLTVTPTYTPAAAAAVVQTSNASPVEVVFESEEIELAPQESVSHVTVTLGCDPESHISNNDIRGQALSVRVPREVVGDDLVCQLRNGIAKQLGVAKAQVLLKLCDQTVRFGRDLESVNKGITPEMLTKESWKGRITYVVLEATPITDAQLDLLAIHSSSAAQSEAKSAGEISQFCSSTNESKDTEKKVGKQIDSKSTQNRDDSTPSGKQSPHFSLLPPSESKQSTFKDPFYRSLTREQERKYYSFVQDEVTGRLLDESDSFDAAESAKSSQVTISKQGDAIRENKEDGSLHSDGAAGRGSSVYETLENLRQELLHTSTRHSIPDDEFDTKILQLRASTASLPKPVLSHIETFRESMYEAVTVAAREVWRDDSPSRLSISLQSSTEFTDKDWIKRSQSSPSSPSSLRIRDRGSSGVVPRLTAETIRTKPTISGDSAYLHKSSSSFKYMGSNLAVDEESDAPLTLTGSTDGLGFSLGQGITGNTRANTHIAKPEKPIKPSKIQKEKQVEEVWERRSFPPADTHPGTRISDVGRAHSTATSKANITIKSKSLSELTPALVEAAKKSLDEEDDDFHNIGTAGTRKEQSFIASRKTTSAAALKTQSQDTLTAGIVSDIAGARTVDPSFNNTGSATANTSNSHTHVGISSGTDTNSKWEFSKHSSAQTSEAKNKVTNISDAKDTESDKVLPISATIHSVNGKSKVTDIWKSLSSDPPTPTTTTISAQIFDHKESSDVLPFTANANTIHDDRENHADGKMSTTPSRSRHSDTSSTHAVISVSPPKRGTETSKLSSSKPEVTAQRLDLNSATEDIPFVVVDDLNEISLTRNAATEGTKNFKATQPLAQKLNMQHLQQVEQPHQQSQPQSINERISRRDWDLDMSESKSITGDEEIGKPREGRTAADSSRSENVEKSRPSIRLSSSHPSTQGPYTKITNSDSHITNYYAPSVPRSTVGIAPNIERTTEIQSNYMSELYKKLNKRSEKLLSSQSADYDEVIPFEQGKPANEKEKPKRQNTYERNGRNRSDSRNDDFHLDNNSSQSPYSPTQSATLTEDTLGYSY